MKINYLKTVIGCTLIPVLSASPLLATTSCGSSSPRKIDLEKTIIYMQDKILEYLPQLAKIPHPTGSTQQIREFVLKELRKCGVHINSDSAGNIWFDLPSTPFYRNNCKVNIIGAFDSYISNSTFEEAKTLPLYLKLNEKDYTISCTDSTKSFGANSIVSLAFILAMTYYKNIIEHPAIRFIIGDESYSLQPSISKMSKDVIDASYVLDFSRAKHHDIDAAYAANYYGNMTIPNLTFGNITAKNAYQYKFSIRGVKGGQYDYVNENNILPGLIIHTLITGLQDYDKDFQFISFNDNTSDAPDLIIPNSAECIIATSIDNELTIANIIDATLNDIRKGFSHEDNVKISYEKIPQEKLFTQALSEEMSDKFNELLYLCFGGNMYSHYFMNFKLIGNQVTSSYLMYDNNLEKLETETLISLTNSVRNIFSNATFVKMSSCDESQNTFTDYAYNKLTQAGIMAGIGSFTYCYSKYNHIAHCIYAARSKVAYLCCGPAIENSFTSGEKIIGVSFEICIRSIFYMFLDLFDA